MYLKEALLGFIRGWKISKEAKDRTNHDNFCESCKLRVDIKAQYVVFYEGSKSDVRVTLFPSLGYQMFGKNRLSRSVYSGK